MREINIREMRALIGQLDEIVAESGGVVVTRRGKYIARVVPVRGARARPSHADLRQRMPLLKIPSSELIRQERDER